MPAGETGRIFVGNDVQFEGYTGGGNKDEIDGLLSSGDVGHFDDAGRLFIDGRDDDMIVSGGENVFPAEVEELLHGHEAVADVAVFGVDDEKFGQRLKAVIVKKGSLSEKDVKDYVKTNLAGYKAPRDVVFVDELPRTSTGKVLKRELKDVVANLRGYAAAHGQLRSRRASGSPPARAGGWTCTSTSTRSSYGGSTLRRRAGARARAPGHLPHHGRRLGAAAALHARASTARACAAWSTRPRRSTSTPTRSTSRAPARSCTRPTWTTASSTSRPGRATRSRWRCPRRSRAGRTAPGLCPQCGANLNEDPEHAHEAEPDPRWAKLSELKFD